VGPLGEGPLGDWPADVPPPLPEAPRRYLGPTTSDYLFWLSQPGSVVTDH
jgi:hypothetical protein